MKIINMLFSILLFLTIFPNSVFANEQNLIKEQEIQSKIDNCSYKILNSNQIQNRVIFVYNSDEKNLF